MNKERLFTGQKVILARVKHADFRGKQGTVERIYKTKNEALVKLEDGSKYRAYPENLDLVELDPTETEAL